ncbi:7210_t:CDS:1, partial [Entrophospora sp. SA101]
MDCHLINIKEQNLKSLDDYLNALKMITDIPSLNNYLQYNVIPIVADFPGQLFIRRAITLLRKQKNTPSTQIPEIVNNFIPILGPLHVSLNMREDIILVHWHFFERMFKSVFGKNKKLAKRPKPTRIN